MGPLVGRLTLGGRRGLCSEVGPGAEGQKVQSPWSPRSWKLLVPTCLAESNRSQPGASLLGLSGCVPSSAYCGVGGGQGSRVRHFRLGH